MDAVLWIAFAVLIAALLALDLFVVHREDEEITTRQALLWTGFYSVLALLFSLAVHAMYDADWFAASPEAGDGAKAALDFLTAWVVEKSLSLDNIFIIALVFVAFDVPAKLQHRVLFWGVIGALVMRGLMIAAGTALLQQLAWMTYVFGAILLATAVRMLVAHEETIEPRKNPFVRLCAKILPVDDHFYGRHFVTRQGGVLIVTRLGLALIVVESSDLLFAVDSIPACFAVTTDPFLVFTSNAFAVLGLRSLYFALAGMLHRFRYLKTSLVFVLAYVGVKMLLVHAYPIPSVVSLAVIVGTLALGITASVVRTRSPHDTGSDP